MKHGGDDGPLRSVPGGVERRAQAPAMAARVWCRRGEELELGGERLVPGERGESGESYPPRGRAQGGRERAGEIDRAPLGRDSERRKTTEIFSEKPPTNF